MSYEIKNLIESILKIPVRDFGTAILPPSATIQEFESEGILFGNGKAKIRGKDIQIDLWYKDKEKLKLDTNSLFLKIEEQFRYAKREIYYDTNARMNRSTIKFSIMEGV